MPDSIVIADTSCLISLSKIGLLNILVQLYSNIHITPEIKNEFGELLPEWIKITEIKDKKIQKILEQLIDPGEASALALALELEHPLLIMDDLKGRNEARKMGFRYTGTLGVITKAKKTGFIEKVKPILDNLKIQGFRLSENVSQEFLKQNNELDLK